MPKLPIETVIEMRAMFAPIMREQTRAMLAAQALGGLLSDKRPGRAWSDYPAIAVELADRTMALLYPEGEA